MKIGKTSNVDPYILLKVNNKNLSACIDTGSAVTLIKSKVLRNISESYKYRKDERAPELIAVNGTKLPTLGIYYIKAFLVDEECLIPCIEVKK